MSKEEGNVLQELLKMTALNFCQNFTTKALLYLNAFKYSFQVKKHITHSTQKEFRRHLEDRRNQNKLGLFSEETIFKSVVVFLPVLQSEVKTNLLERLLFTCEVQALTFCKNNLVAIKTPQVNNKIFFLFSFLIILKETPFNMTLFGFQHLNILDQILKFLVSLEKMEIQSCTLDF